MADDGLGFAVIVTDHNPSLGRRRQWLATIVVTLGIFGLGTVVSWSSPGIPALEESGEMGNISYSDKAWIGSMSMVGAFSASPLAGFCVERIGRKKTMIALAFPFIAGWTLIALAPSLPLLYIGRFVTGFAAGGFSLAVPIFISEISENHIRGILSSFFQLMMVIGILVVYIVGAYVSWQTLSWISLVAPVAFLLSIHFIPETPRCFISLDKRSDAIRSLMWYRGATKPEQVAEEMDGIVKSVAESKAEKITLRHFISPQVLQPVLICLSLMVFEQLSGFNAVIFYTVDIFSAAGSEIDAHLSTVIVGGVQVAATIVSSILVDMTGRRVLLIFSEVVMTVSLAGLGFFFYLQHRNGGVPPEGLGWLPLTSLIVFIVAVAQGIGPLSWTVMGEVLPPNLKGECSAFAVFLVWFTAFLVTASYEHLLQALGIHWCFWLFGFFCLIATIVITLYVPETKGRSLDEIQQLFNKNEGSCGAEEKLTDCCDEA